MKKLNYFVLTLLVLCFSSFAAFQQIEPTTEIRCPEGDEFTCYTTEQVSVKKGKGETVVIVRDFSLK